MGWSLVGRADHLVSSIDRLASGTGTAFVGPPGTGKSRLLREVLDRSEQSGWGVVRATATPSMAGIPFAAFVELLDLPTAGPPTEVVGAALEALGDRRGPNGLILGVDDVHLLDPGSLSLVTGAAHRGLASLVLTGRAGEPLAAEVVDLWTGGLVERIEVLPLERSDADALVVARLGRVAPELLAELWRIGEGNPLVVHELVEGAVGGALRQDADGTWQQHGPLAESSRLTDLVRARLDVLSIDERHAVEMVALAAPLPLPILKAVVDTEVADLEQRRLVDVVSSSGGPVVVPAHPLHGEVLRATLSGARRCELLTELVEAVGDDDDRIDPVRAAVWRHEAGMVVRPRLAIEGATLALARHDPLLAERLARPVHATAPDLGALPLAKALTHQGRFDEAEALLRDVEPTDPEARAEVASIRAHNLALGLDRAEDALAVLRDAIDDVGDARLGARLDVDRSVVAAVRGDLVEARSAGRSLVTNPAASPGARAAGYVSLTLALTMTADCEGLGAVIAEAREAAATAASDMPFALDQVELMHVFGCWIAGRVEESVAAASDNVVRSEGTGTHSTWLGTFAATCDLAGHLADALRSAEEALGLMGRFDPFGLERQVRGIVALERGQRGDTRAGETVEALVLDARDPRLAVWVDRGRAWSRAAGGSAPDGALIAARGGQEAVAGQHVAWGAMALHDAVRLGRPDLVHADLASLRGSPGAALVEVVADHADALSAQDGRGLLAVAVRFGAMGANLLAAEAAAQASLALSGVEAARAACLSELWEAQCQDPVTPALAARRPCASSREIEVACEAVAGKTSAAVAEEKFISVRTVENHLRSVYRKLGVDGREGLKEVLSPALAPDRGEGSQP
ncbi:helix-turn-helix transcriptional regulator [Rhabdothermincola salaria]|uniref:helix-turn-helix transcriptional regulator n=1 Tax=Rhabdothermincola salaria TaxID=2903142 RepID=UPI001E3D5D89|nr:LuxR C-terminal-related transcriptional regulator [Rhabdothermincola salaria]MCD9625323.1 AAA family ATPase [Rhabdothermincola salaria]